MSKTRNTLLDWLRALAIVMIVTVHTWSLSHIDSSEHSALAICYRLFYQCGVPLFVMFSGALQLSTPVSSISRYYKRRYIRILVPFVFWSMIVYVLSCLAGKYAEVQTLPDVLTHYLPYLLTNRINAAYWFMGLIIVLYGITPFLQRALAPCSRKELIIICLGWLCFVITRKFFPSFYLLEYSSRLTYFLGFYILGYLLYREWGETWQPSSNKIIDAVSNSSYMTYLMHMIFITPLYTLLGFNGAQAPLWQCILFPICTSLVVVIFCTCLALMVKRLLPTTHTYLGIN